MIEVYYYNITFSELSDEVFGEGYKYGHVPTDHPGYFRSLRRSVTRRRTPTEIRAVESKKKNGCDFVIISRRRYTKMLTSERSTPTSIFFDDMVSIDTGRIRVSSGRCGRRSWPSIWIRTQSGNYYDEEKKITRRSRFCDLPARWRKTYLKFE